MLSGAVALGLEAAWFRRMLPVFGATHTVTGLLLAVYMTGLALGGALGATLARRARRPLRAYALCEGAVSLGALASLPALQWIDRALVARSTLSAGVAAAVVLAVPTTAMGATTALLVRHASDEGVSFRAALSRLYSANLVGASLGAVITGFVLLPRFGISAVHRGWSLVGVAVAALAWTLDALLRSRATDGDSVDSPATVPALNDDSPLPDRSERGSAALVAFAVGALSFALQVSLGRVAAVLLGSTAYTFEMLAATILLSLAAGGTLGRGEDESSARAWANVSRRALRVAVAVFLAMLLVRVVPLYVQVAVRGGARPGVVRWVVALALAVWPYVEIGALFPTLASRMRVGDAGRDAGFATAVVTAGNVAGSLLAALVAIPSMGLQSTLRAVALACLALSVLAALRSDRVRSRSTLAAAAIALLFGRWLDRPWDAVALSAGTYRTNLNRSIAERADAPCGPGRRLADTRVLSHEDGPMGTVTVLSHSDRASCTLYGLRVNGKTEGSVFVAAPPSPRGAAAFSRDAWLPVGDLPSERLVGGVVASLFDRRPGPAMLVGWGTGISSRALLDACDGPILAAEIEPAVLRAALYFDAEITRDRAVTVLVDDARRVLRRSAPASFDAIVSHPSNPWVSGATALFSREWFALARSRLRPGGRMVAWVQLYEIDVDGVRSLVRTFVERFPDAVAIRTSPRARDLFLVGANGGPALNPAAIERALRARPAFDALRVVGNGAALARWSESAPLVTDDNALLEYRVADVMLSGREDPRTMALEGL